MSALSDFAKATAERAVKTFAETEGALLVASGAGLVDAPWWASLSAAGMATLLSVLASVASSGFGGPGPSATGAEKLQA